MSSTFTKRKTTGSRKNFLATAKPLNTTIGTLPMPISPKEFSTGSVGYYGNGKLVIDGVEFQVGITLTAIGSKEWAE